MSKFSSKRLSHFKNVSNVLNISTYRNVNTWSPLAIAFNTQPNNHGFDFDLVKKTWVRTKINLISLPSVYLS